MNFLEKVIDWLIWLLIIGGIGWFIYGLYQLTSVMFIRG
jgi:hypothetical protein